MAQPFDATHVAVSGEPVRIADGLAVAANGALADFAVSNTGVLVYRTGTARALSRLTWYDRTGKALGPEIGRAHV